MRLPNAQTRYKLSDKKKATIEAWAYREITSTDAAEDFGVPKQNFPIIPANVLRHMIADSAEFARAFIKALKAY